MKPYSKVTLQNVLKYALIKVIKLANYGVKL